MITLDAAVGGSVAVRADNISDVASRIEQISGKTLYGKSISIERFESALANAGHLNGVSPVQTAQAGQQSHQVAQLNSQNATSSATASNSVVQGVNPVAETNGAARNRALRGLDLEKSAVDAKPNETGDSILDGLSRLRGVFDNQENAITSIASSPLTGADKLVTLQLEVVKYSMLMDMTSKLTGKSTQAFDTLMKGQ